MMLFLVKHLIVRGLHVKDMRLEALEVGTAIGKKSLTVQRTWSRQLKWNG